MKVLCDHVKECPNTDCIHAKLHRTVRVSPMPVTRASILCRELGYCETLGVYVQCMPEEWHKRQEV